MKSITLPAPMTAREKIAQLKKDIRAAQDAYINKQTAQSGPLSFREVKGMIYHATSIDLNENGETIFHPRTPMQWTDTKI